MSEINKNSEILFLYDATLTNPNGDPDDENRPRIDPKTGVNLVTDVRLKRYFRDFIINHYGNEYIWVAKQEEGGTMRSVQPKERLSTLGVDA